MLLKCVVFDDLSNFHLPCTRARGHLTHTNRRLHASGSHFSWPPPNSRLPRLICCANGIFTWQKPRRSNLHTSYNILHSLHILCGLLACICDGEDFRIAHSVKYLNFTLTDIRPGKQASPRIYRWFRHRMPYMRCAHWRTPETDEEGGR